MPTNNGLLMRITIKSRFALIQYRGDVSNGLSLMGTLHDAYMQ